MKIKNSRKPKDRINELEDRVAQLEYALMFIRQHASRKNIWYAAVADAALQGDVVQRGRK